MLVCDSVCPCAGDTVKEQSFAGWAGAGQPEVAAEAGGTATATGSCCYQDPPGELTPAAEQPVPVL